MKPLVFVTLAAVLMPHAGYSAEPRFESPPPGYRIGMELEVSSQAFQNLVEDFDFTRLQKEKERSFYSWLPRNFFDDYLQDSSVWFTLPESAREELGQGLNLRTLIQVPANPKEPPRPSHEPRLHDVPASGARIILPGEGAPVATAPGDVLPERRLLQPNGRPVLELQAKTSPDLRLPSGKEGFQMMDGSPLAVPDRLAWGALEERWKKLGWAAKTRLVDWSRLSSAKKALLAIDYAYGDIHLKADLPPDVAAIYAPLEWTRDGSMLEFFHREDKPVTEPGAFYQDVIRLSRRAGLESQITDPVGTEMRNQWFKRKSMGNLHFHESIAGRDLTGVGKALNDLGAVERLAFGNVVDLRVGHGIGIYDPTALSKGIVRAWAKNDPSRIETRAQTGSLADTLQFHLKLYSLPESEALKAIRDRIQVLMTDPVANLLIEKGAEKLFYFIRYMTPEQKARAARKLKELDLVRLFSLHSDQVPVFMSYPDPEVRLRVADWLLHLNEAWSQTEWDLVPSLLRDPDPQVRALGARALGFQRDRATALLKDPDPEIRAKAAQILQSQRRLGIEDCVAEQLFP